MLVMLALHVGAFAQTYDLSTETTTEYWQPVTGWRSSLDVTTAVQGLVWLQSKTGNFQARLGIQTANFIDSPSTPVAIGTQASQITTAGEGAVVFYRFDPNASNNGDIDTKARFRLGVLYSLSAAGAGQGTVVVQDIVYR